MPTRVTGAVQSESELRDVLDLLYAKSKEGRSFTGILELAMNEEVIVTAIHNLKSNPGAKTPGVDGRSIDHYLHMSREEVIRQVQEAFQDYHPKPARRKYIPKANGKMRPLGIPTVLDRIIQECLRIVLEPILEARFHPHSYGFRPYRSTEHAVARVVDLIHRGNYHAIEGDIKGFFDAVNHRLLLRKLRRLGILDKRVLAIIRKMLQAGFLEEGQFHPTGEGTPQGGILSPLLANAYLNSFDWTIARMYADPKNWQLRYAEKRIAQTALGRQGKTSIYLARYADDWIVLTKTQKEARRLHRWLRKYFLHRLKLELSEEKTLCTDARETRLKFLGFRIEAAPRRPTPDRPKPKIVGKSFPDPEKVKGKIREIRGMIRRLAALPTDADRAAQIERINAVIVGAAQYWRIGISKKVFSKIDHAVHHTASLTFRTIYQDRHRDHLVPIHTLHNRLSRHQGGEKKRTSKTWAVEIEGRRIGFTLASITPVRYSRLYPPEMVPYTQEGRQQHQRLTKVKEPLPRPPPFEKEILPDPLSPELAGRYNFEFFMNSGYAFNQTFRIKKAEPGCPVCHAVLGPGNRKLHHKDPNLPLREVNKVQNLIWLCNRCQEYVVHGIPDSIAAVTPRMRERIEKLRDDRMK